MDTQDLIEKIIKALKFTFPEDKMAPGLTLAYLPNGDYYASLVRYTPNKTVIAKSKGEELQTVLYEVAKQLLNMKNANYNPLIALQNLMNLDEKSNRRNAYPCPDPFVDDDGNYYDDGL